jgi:trans-aconitate 2-methyltransferase
MPHWDAAIYLKFSTERTQPSIDLIQRIAIADPHRIVDLGCGPGNSTEALRRRWPNASIAGLDSSPEMIAAARQAYPSAAWEVADAATWNASEPCDVVFANALLQWIPDHARLCRHLIEQVAPGGALAVQVPAAAHYESPVHREIRDVSRDPAWRDRLEPARTMFTHAPAAFYYDTLQPLASRIDLWETTYYHVVAGPEALLEWYRGTGLRPFLEALANDEERRDFERQVLDRYIAAYPRQPGGRVLFPFQRLFFVACR